MHKRLEHKTTIGETICYTKTQGSSPTLLWLGGFRSDMNGTKAEFMHDLAVRENLSFLRFDYFGHGLSSGKFEDGCISRWRDDVLEVVDHLTSGPVILLGSSMGGWLALLAALARPTRIKALGLIAPASDFTRSLMWAGFDQKTRDAIMSAGVWMQASPYGPTPITRKLIEDGDQNLLMHQPIQFEGPVRILQGQLDDAVPWRHAAKLVDLLSSPDVVFNLSKSGDHSLSSPDDLVRLQSTVL